MWTLVLVAGALLDRGRPALDAVQAQSISAAVRFLSDDLLEGRGTGTRGHAIAEQYVASRMQASGSVQLERADTSSGSSSANRGPKAR